MDLSSVAYFGCLSQEGEIRVVMWYNERISTNVGKE